MHSFKFFQSLLVSQIFVFAKQVLAPGPYFLHPVLVPVFDQLEANFTFFAFKLKKKICCFGLLYQMKTEI